MGAEGPAMAYVVYSPAGDLVESGSIPLRPILDQIDGATRGLPSEWRARWEAEEDAEADRLLEEAGIEVRGKDLVLVIRRFGETGPMRLGGSYPISSR